MGGQLLEAYMGLAGMPLVGPLAAIPPVLAANAAVSGASAVGQAAIGAAQQAIDGYTGPAAGSGQSGQPQR